MNLDFPYKTPENFYIGVEGFGFAESKNEGELWLENLPRNAILVRSEFYFSALREGYCDFTVGLKDGECYNVLIPKKEAKDDSND